MQRVYERWAQGDFSQNDAFDPEVEFAMVDWPEGSSAHGRDAMWRSWRSALSVWEDFRAEPTEFIDAGEDSVVVLTHVEGRGKGSGLAMQAETATCGRLMLGRWLDSPSTGTRRRPSKPPGFRSRRRLPSEHARFTRAAGWLS